MLARFFYFVSNVLYICDRKQACFIEQARTKYAVLFLSLFSLCKTTRVLHYPKGRTDLSVTCRAWLMYVAVVPGILPQQYKCNRGSANAWH